MKPARRGRILFYGILGAIGVVCLGYLVLLAVIWQHERAIADRLDALMPLVRRHADRTGLDAAFIRAVIRAESGGDPRAVSRKKARGLMQIMPDAETDAMKRLNVPRGDLFDPEYNVLIGTEYLKHLSERFDGDVHLTLAAYHMGQARVRSIQRAHPGLSGAELVKRYANPTTRAYVDNVVKYMRGRGG